MKASLRIRKKLTKTSFYALFTEFGLSLIKSHYHRLGWKDEGSHLEKLTRVKILGLACKFDYRPCREEARKKFKQWIEGNKEERSIEPNFRSIVYCYGIQEYEDVDIWTEMWTRYLSEINSQEKAKLAIGLAQVQNAEILAKFMDLAKVEENVRSQDYFSILSYISLNPIGQPLVWKFVQSEWTYLVKRFGIGNPYIGGLVKRVVDDFSTEAELKEVETFFTQNPEAGAGARARKQAVEEIKINILWNTNYLDGIRSWIYEGKYKESSSTSQKS